mmetsp:Transcript_61989/g.147709  ORF Transcript_61989/g.147709 Transcript_61989/m.147709 type:complete len:241 (-) Transcript_61989:1836-2558(-)
MHVHEDPSSDPQHVHGQGRPLDRGCRGQGAAARGAWRGVRHVAMIHVQAGGVARRELWRGTAGRRKEASGEARGCRSSLASRVEPVEELDALLAGIDVLAGRELFPGSHQEVVAVVGGVPPVLARLLLHHLHIVQDREDVCEEVRGVLQLLRDLLHLKKRERLVALLLHVRLEQHLALLQRLLQLHRGRVRPQLRLGVRGRQPRRPARLLARVPHHDPCDAPRDVAVHVRASHRRVDPRD